MSKKPLIIIASVLVAVIALLGLTTAIGTSYIRSYLNENGEEIIGRKIYVEDLSANVFTGSISLDSLNIYEADGTRSFVKARHIDANLAVWHLLLGVADFEYLNVDGLFVNVEQRDTVFNFTDILTFLDGGAPAVNGEAMAASLANVTRNDENDNDNENDDNGIPVVLRDIVISNSRVQYRDLLVRSHFELDPLNLHIPGIDLRDLNTKVGLELAFVEGGTLRTEVEYQDRAARYAVHLTLHGFEMKSLLPYVQQSLLAKEMEGTLDAEMQIRGSLKHVLDFNVTGEARVLDFELEDGNGDEALECDSLHIGISEVKLLKNRIGLSHLRVYRPRIEISYGRDSIDNFSRMMLEAEKLANESNPSNLTDESVLVKESVLVNEDNQDLSDNETPGTSAAPVSSSNEAPWQFTIGNFQIIEGSLSYCDNATPVKTFEYEVSRISVNAPQFSLQGNNNIKGKAVLGKEGSVTLEYHGKLEDQSNMRFGLEVKNLDLEDFSPYTLQMFGNEIKNGTFSADLSLTTVNSELTGSLHLLADQPKVGKKQRKLHPEYNVPFRTGIYVLTDRKGRCEFNIPLSGNINEPEFSYKRIIFRTLGKLIVKVCTGGRRRASDQATSDSLLTHYSSFDLDDIDIDQYRNDSIGDAELNEEME